jgi:hypothetical protein
MKQTVLVSFLTSFFALIFTTSAFSQISIQSSKGYSVNIDIQPVELVVNSTNPQSCKWGYNYNLKLNYSVTITGKNAPKNMWTLQGSIKNNSVSHFFQLPVKGGQGTTTSRSNVWRSQSDCATATIATMSLNTVDIQIEGDGISSRTVSFPVVSSTLPVKMADFQVKLENGRVKLDWSTATELNNDFFTVERAINGGEWTAIKTIKGAGNSTDLRHYSAIDDNLVNGTINYRIRQTDFDGKTDISEVKTIRNSATNNKSISLYPIPNTGNTINLSGLTDYTKTELSILNASGNNIFATTLSSSSVELPHLSTGIYFIRIKDKQTGEVSNIRYVKI